MIEVIMHFIPSPFFPAAEDIGIISCIGACCYNTHHTSLIRPTFRFTEINIARRDNNHVG